MRVSQTRGERLPDGLVEVVLPSSGAVGVAFAIRLGTLRRCERETFTRGQSWQSSRGTTRRLALVLALFTSLFNIGILRVAPSTSISPSRQSDGTTAVLPGPTRLVPFGLALALVFALPSRVHDTLASSPSPSPTSVIFLCMRPDGPRCALVLPDVAHHPTHGMRLGRRRADHGEGEGVGKRVGKVGTVASGSDAMRVWMGLTTV